jgi:Helix-turn-helix domain
VLEIGSSLRAARKQQRLTLPEIEASTMIPARYLQALEEERFEALPTGAYRRSFLREYADFLGLEGPVYAEEYELRFAPVEPPPEPPPSPISSAISYVRDGVTPLRVAVVSAVVLLAAIAVWRFSGSGGPGTPAPASEAVAPPAAAIHHATHRPQRPHTPVRPAATTTVATTAVLTLTATKGDCWVSVHVGSPTGPAIFERTLAPGQHALFGLRKTLWIRMGAPWNLSASIGKRNVDATLPSTTGDVTATRTGFQPAA